MNKVDWLIIDWGTTNFRAFAMLDGGALVDKIEQPLGLLQVRDGEFAQELECVLKAWLGDYQHLPIYMAGMVGSAQGWVDVPYVPAPVASEQLALGAHQLVLPWGAKATIVPGVSYQNQQGDFDVMRGEEVQLFGLQHLIGEPSFCAALPGTHSKHVSVEQGELTQFRTFMTGEMFSLLAEHSILGRGLPKQIASEPAFLKGVEESGGSDLTAKLFSVRTHRLFSNLSEESVLDYLSGLLIGQELKSLNTRHLYLVGGTRLCEHYQMACEALNVTNEYINGDEAFLVGMRQIKQVMNNDK